MLIGEYQHSLDLKGRIFIPAKLREDLGEKFVVAKGSGQCLFAYSKEEWKRLEAEIKKLPMQTGRPLQLYFFASAAELEADKQGRVVIPQKLREHAGLEKDVTIIGASSRVEIWDTSLWEQQCENLTPDSIQEAMGMLGFC